MTGWIHCLLVLGNTTVLALRCGFTWDLMPWEVLAEQFSLSLAFEVTPFAIRAEGQERIRLFMLNMNAIDVDWWSESSWFYEYVVIRQIWDIYFIADEAMAGTRLVCMMGDKSSLCNPSSYWNCSFFAFLDARVSECITIFWNATCFHPLCSMTMFWFDMKRMRQSTSWTVVRTQLSLSVIWQAMASEELVRMR